MDALSAESSGYIKLTIEKIIEEAPEVKTFILSSNTTLPYKAGQFLTFIFQNGGKEERRSYSLSSSPDRDEHLSITIKRVTNGKYSRPLIDLAKVGDVLTAVPPSGQFILPEDVKNYKQIIFFAAGIGITPIYSTIKSALVQYPFLELVLIYSNSSIHDTVFYNELLQLQHEYPAQLKLELLFSSSRDLTKARLSKWLLPQLMQVYSRHEKNKQLFYTCGPFPYMRMVIIALEEQGYDNAQIRRELFDTTLPVIKKEPPDKEAHDVTIAFREKHSEFQMQYPDTILQAAHKNNIMIPYSCETGKCGACAMRCIAGSIWMSYNEVLTEKDMQEGKILTCTGYPVGGDVTLQFL